MLSKCFIFKIPGTRISDGHNQAGYIFVVDNEIVVERLPGQACEQLLWEIGALVL